ncbi:MAG TPA: mechanosensitive ion channel domain-containing protein [Ktedonobacterales bacterium]|nr:mechanosensitive ion channel domain-containing protein [Ktedonobacterales bacterium]
MGAWFDQLLNTISLHPLDFGLRAGAIGAVIVVGVVLGRWLQSIVDRFPVRAQSAFGQRGGRLSPLLMRSGVSRWIGRLTFASVLLATALAVLAIVEYGNPAWPAFDARQLLRALGSVTEQIVATLVVAPLAVAVGRLLQRVTVATLAGPPMRLDDSLSLLGSRVVYVICLIAGVFILLAVWNVPLILPVTFLSALTLALGLALQDVMKNIFAGIYLLIERPFIIGDEITITTFSGRVETIQLRITSLLAPDGQRVLVPNSLLFSSAVVNATAAQRRRAEVTVSLPAGGTEHYAQVEERILAACQQVAAVLQDPKPQVMLSRVSQGKMDLRVVFWVPSRDEAQAQTAIAESMDSIRIALDGAEVAVAGLVAATT